MKRTALILTIKIIRQCLLSIAGIISAMTIHAQIPLLNSYTPAYATVYLDFDGQHVEGSIWNRQGPIDANPARSVNQRYHGNIQSRFRRLSSVQYKYNHRSQSIRASARIAARKDHNYFHQQLVWQCCRRFVHRLIYMGRRYAWLGIQQFIRKQSEVCGCLRFA